MDVLFQDDLAFLAELAQEKPSDVRDVAEKYLDSLALPCFRGSGPHKKTDDISPEDAYWLDYRDQLVQKKETEEDRRKFESPALRRHLHRLGSPTDVRFASSLETPLIDPFPKGPARVARVKKNNPPEKKREKSKGLETLADDVRQARRRLRQADLEAQEQEEHNKKIESVRMRRADLVNLSNRKQRISMTSSCASLPGVSMVPETRARTRARSLTPNTIRELGTPSPDPSRRRPPVHVRNRLSDNPYRVQRKRTPLRRRRPASLPAIGTQPSSPIPDAPLTSPWR